MPKIIHNLEEFTRVLIDFIRKDTLEGKVRLNQVIKAARKNYSDDDSWSSYLSPRAYARSRDEHFKTLLEKIEAMTDDINILLPFCEFFSHGAWKNTSANVKLFSLLIDELNKYQKENQEEEYEQENQELVRLTIITAINGIFAKQVAKILNAQKHLEQQKHDLYKELKTINNPQRYKELQGMVNALNDVRDVVLLEHDTLPQSLAKEHPENYCFQLIQNPSTCEGQYNWKLVWHDATGRSQPLVLTPALKAILNNLSSLDQASSQQQIDLKKYSRELVKDELDSKVKIIINPKNEALKDLASTYVVNTEELKLEWYDSLGKKSLVSIEDNERVLTLLRDKEHLNEKITQLQVALYHLPKRKPVAELSQENVHQVLMKKRGVTLVLANNVNQIKPYLLVPGVYILTKENEGWVLYLRQKGRVNCRVDINLLNNEQLSFAKVLADVQGLPEQISAVTKEKLRNCIGSYLDRMQQIIDKEKPSQVVEKYFAPARKKIDLKQFSQVTNFFGHKPAVSVKDKETQDLFNELPGFVHEANELKTQSVMSSSQ